MPRTYIRTSNRGQWSEESLQMAMEHVRTGGMNCFRASQDYGIPYRTLKRRLEKNDEKKHAMGPQSCLGEENEKKLVTYIRQLQISGFPPTGENLRKLAFQFAERNGIPHRFRRENGMAGWDWLQSFLKRFPTLVTKKPQGLSVDRAMAMNREAIAEYFSLILDVLSANNLLDKPGHLYNMDETGFQMNPRPDTVIAEKGSPTLYQVTSGEKGETITVIACCNAEGNFIPPACILKGKRKKPEWEDGLPNGSTVYMNEKSGYVTSDIFMSWLKDHFIPRKQQGKVVLFLDGHASHCTDPDMLDLAARNDVIMICLPPHSTHFLQPLDRCVFKSLKQAFYKAMRNWTLSHPGRKVSRAQFPIFLTEAWKKAAVPSTAQSGFEACGLYPYNPERIPDEAFQLSDLVSTNEADRNERDYSDCRGCAIPSEKDSNRLEDRMESAIANETMPGTSFEAISPIPVLDPLPKRRKKSAAVLTEQHRIEDARAR
ncbi:uncharacterized protein [Anabrus simplex]|uniref:uncharacterized protein n=1 Tax=Anabrus simplex TaxID=316456 RepID=UPI0035A3778D